MFPTITRDGVGGLARRWAIRAGHAWSVRRRAAALWLVLSIGTAAAVCRTEFPPFYDYYQWLNQGHVVSALLFGPDAPDITGSYELMPVPVPNLAAPVLIGLLNTVLPIEAAGTAFLAMTALGFAAAFGSLDPAATDRGRVPRVPLGDGLLPLRGVPQLRVRHRRDVRARRRAPLGR